MRSLTPVPSLPSYTGPYNVGSSEFEIPTSKIASQVPSPDPQISTIKYRLFYPTDARPSLGKQYITWVPHPQKRWTEAFMGFLGPSSAWSAVMRPFMSLLTLVNIPAIPNTPLLRRTGDAEYPIVIFSHGLAGNCNTYSSLCGLLASCGIVCAAIEHRDGSSPTTLVRSADGTVATSIGYKRYSHSPSPEVLNGRNAQLRIRMWELNLLYASLLQLNDGEEMANYTTTETEKAATSFRNALDFRPGHVTWVGHSFGATTISQFVKSIYHHQSLPSLKGTPNQNDHNWKPLLQLQPSSKLVEQITPSSPVALLDLWTLPLRAPSTNWLWRKPLPCYHSIEDISGNKPTTAAIISTEFYNWTELLNRTRASLSRDPVQAIRRLDREEQSSMPPTEQTSSPPVSTPPDKHPLEPPETAETEPSLLPPPSLPTDDLNPTTNLSPPSTSRTPSPSSAPTLSHSPTPASSQTSLPPPQHPTSLPAKLFHLTHSAHLSQSDFGVLFPTITRWLMNAVDPRGMIEMNARAVAALMRNAGLAVAEVNGERLKKRSGGWFSWGWAGEECEGSEGEGEDGILEGKVGAEWEKRWIEVPLV